MFELAGHALDAWRIVLHVSALTGISAAVLVGLGFLAFMLPEWRAIAIRAAIVIGAAYITGLVMFHLGAADVRAQWDDANARAELARQARDAEVKADAEREMAPLVAQMRSALEDRNKKVTQYERELLAAKSGAASCELGAGALRLRNHKAR